MRKLATIATIGSVNPHPNADAIELATVRGWQVVVKKGEFQAGDRCVYCEIDSVMPERPEFEFLRPKKFRIKTARLRGELSQGIAFPLSILNGVHHSLDEGNDVTELLGVKLYEPEVSAHIGGDIEGAFLGFIPKTDEERIQNCAWILEEYAETEWEITEKLDGTSSTYAWKDGEFIVCSRNWRMKDTPQNLHWKMAHSMGLPAKMAAYGKNIALQGEIIGPKIQGNPYNLECPEVRFFTAFDIDKGEYLNHYELKDICEKFAVNSVPWVIKIPGIRHLRYPSLQRTLEDVLLMADGCSFINPDMRREGVVWRPTIEQRDHRLGRLSFKVISNAWLLKK